MGTWGIDSFDNDTACDFAGDIVDGGGLGKVEAALQKVVDSGPEYVESSDAEEALVAAEVVARLQGRFGARNAYTEELDRWIGEHPHRPSPELIDKAVRAIERLLVPPSEIVELWGEGEDLKAWRDGVLALRSRVDPSLK